MQKPTRILPVVILLLLASLLLTGCGTTPNAPPPTVDVEGTVAARVQETVDAKATADAQMVTTAAPTDTPAPTPTTKPKSTNTPVPTDSPASADTPTPMPIISDTLAPVSASIFREEFESPDLDEVRWEISGPPIKMENGAIRLESNLGVFPYVYAKQNPFPIEDNFSFEALLRYPNITGRGVGLALANTIPPLGVEASSPNRNFLIVWQDAGSGFHVHFLGNRIFSVSPDLSQHAIEVQYDGKYHITIDEKLVYTSEAMTDRPSALWFGNPRNVGGSGEWSSLEIDYIDIKSTQ